MAALTDKPNDIQRRLQDLLIYPREDLDTELKSWLDLTKDEAKASLAQAILALANSGGGYVLIGFGEQEGIWVPAESRPPDLNHYTQDFINGIVAHYAEPSFHCEVHHVPHPQDGQLFPVISVPGDHKVPIRTKSAGPGNRHIQQNVYYIRRPGPVSEPPQTAREWDELIGRCIRASREELLDNMRSLLLGFGNISVAPKPEQETKKRLETWIHESKLRWKSLVDKRLSDEKPSRYAKGIWCVGYSIVGKFAQPSLTQLLGLLTKVRGHETGWPPWWIPTRKELAPYPYEGAIECWLADVSSRDAGHSDFWRASPNGIMFLLRGYQEDGGQDQQNISRTMFDLTLPIWRVGECLLHAERLAAALGDRSASVIFQVAWEGLAGRTLVSWANPRRYLSVLRISKQDKVVSEITITADQISVTLPETVRALTAPLYQVFDFFEPPMSLIKEELSEMKGR